MESFSKYNSLLTVRSDRFFFHIHELNLIGSGPDVASAYADLRRRFDELLNEAKQADLLNSLPPPTGGGRKTGGLILANIVPFLIKIAIAAGVVLAILFPALSMVQGVVKRTLPRIEATVEKSVDKIEAAVDRASSKIMIKSGREFWSGLEKGLHRVAGPENEISDERREKLLSSLHILIKRVSPFTAELPLLFSYQSSAPVCIPAAASPP
ncbi:MAG: hypothetical protein WCK65_04515 [Rhodospirillaceae bacterium]